MKMNYTVEMNPEERQAYNALVFLSRILEPQHVEHTPVVVNIKQTMPDVWMLFEADRMCGECTGAGQDFDGYYCKVCGATGYVAVNERTP